MSITYTEAAAQRSQRVRSRFSRRRARAAVLAFAALAATAATAATGAPAHAEVPTDQQCHNSWMTAAGTGGSGEKFQISLRPTWKARLAPAHRDTQPIWDDLWSCVKGGYDAAGLTREQGESVYQQLYCHVKYGYLAPFTGPTWDLEAYRPPISWDRIVIPAKAYAHRCNWTQ